MNKTYKTGSTALVLILFNDTEQNKLPIYY